MKTNQITFTEKPSFAFAVYEGRPSNENTVKWICYNGVFSIAMNRSMIDLLIRTIDAGGSVVDDEVVLDNEMADLLDAIEDLDDKTQIKDTGIFKVMCIDSVYTLHCDAKGLMCLCDAVKTGADYSSEDGKTLYAFVQVGNIRSRQWQQKLQRSAMNNRRRVG